MPHGGLFRHFIDMPHFTFVAKDSHGRNYRGSLYGATEQSVYFRLQKLGYVVLAVTEQTEVSEDAPLLPQRITNEDKVVFAKLLSVVIDAGLPAVDALAALEEQTGNFTLKKVIKKIREDVEHGMSLSSAFEKHPKVFEHYFISMIRSGESAGNLAEVLIRLSTYMEKDHDLRRSLKGAFIYPKIVLTIAAFAVAFLMVFAIPKISKFYESQGGPGSSFQLPKITQIMVNTSNFIAHEWQFDIAIVLGIFAIVYFLKYTAQGKLITNRLYLKIPIYAQLYKRILVSRFTRTMSSMIYCGVPLLSALDTAKGVLDNHLIELDVDKMIETVETGGNMSSALRLSQYFPPLVVYMISAGEHSGRLADLLGTCSGALEKEIEYYTKRLLLYIEPLVTIFVALVVGFIAIAMYLPIFNIVMAPK